MPYSLEQLQAMARQTAITYGIDPSIFLGLVDKESSFSINATTPYSSAFGLTQVTNAAQSDVGTNRNLLFNNPQAQLDAGAAYLKQMLGKFNGDYFAALGAYNQGAGNAGSSAANSYASDVLARSKKFLTLDDGKNLLDKAGNFMSSILNYDIGKAAEDAISKAAPSIGIDLNSWFERIAVAILALLIIAAALYMLAPKSVEKVAAVAS